MTSGNERQQAIKNDNEWQRMITRGTASYSKQQRMLYWLNQILNTVCFPEMDYT